MESSRMRKAQVKWKAAVSGMLAVVLLLGSVFAGGPMLKRASASTGGGLLVNGGYEELSGGGFPQNWSTWVSSGTPSFASDEAVFAEGKRSLRISASSASRGTAFQVVLLQPSQKGKTYRLRQWIRTEDVTGAGAFSRIFLTNESGSRAGNLIELKKLTGTGGWTLTEGFVSVPNDANIAGIKVENFFETGTGTAWFDGAELEPADGTANTVVNGGFEVGGSSGLPAGWSSWVPIGTPAIGVDSSVYRSGAASLKVESQTTGRAAVIQTIPLSPSQLGNAFKAEAWAKTLDVTGSALARLQYVNSSGARVGDLVMLGSVTGTEEDWTKLEKITIVPANSAIVGVKLELFFEQGTGTVWFDDVRFAPWIPLQSIALDKDELVMEAGDTATLAVLATPANASDASVAWSSSQPEVATVAAGIVTAHANGLAVVAATSVDGNHKGEAIVIVGGTDTIIAEDAAVQTDENGYIQGQADAVSTMGYPLSYSLLSRPKHGLADVTASGAWSYYPDEGYSGEDGFVIAIQDGEGGFAITRIHVQVIGVNAAPEAQEGIHPTDKNKTVNAAVIASDADDDALSYTLVEAPLHGEAALQSDGKWTYTPDLDYTGADSFTVKVEDGNGGTAEALMRVYTAPTSDEIIASLKAAHPHNGHPRLLATEDDFQRMIGLLDTDERFAEWAERAIGEADQLLTQPVRDYNKPDGLRLDSSSSARIVSLAFAYRLTGKVAYAERAWLELEHVSGAAYPDWSPQHYLDTAAMTYGVAIGYDWLYDYMTQSQRDTVRQAIVDKGLTPAVPMYLEKTYWWVYNRDNWNFVCNAGMAIGALAIADEEEELSGLILREAFKSIQYGLPQYAPDGSAKEGPSYWEYGTIYLIYFLAGLDSTFGHDFGFSEREGLAETPLYPLHIAGPEGTFNYFDNAETLIPGRALLWFANHHNKPEYTWYHEFAAERRIQPGLYDALWYRPELYGANPPQELDRKMEIPRAVTMRSDWDDPNALFVGFKGGMNGAPHGDLDTGSFIFDANGVRWALDIGKEDYNLPGYWNMGETGQRWTYYRKRAEGHNTLQISPSTGPDQDVDSISEVTDTSFNETGGAFAVADLTPAYRKSAASVKRGVALLDERRQFLVQDEIKAKVPSEVYWFMHTRAAIEIAADGQSALLTQDGRQLWVNIEAPAKASFTVMDAAPLPSSPNPSGQTPNLGVKKLAIHMNDVRNETISVRMVPLMPGETPPSDTREVVPIQDWTIENGELASLSALTVDGQSLEEFKPIRYVYEVELENGETQPPVIGAAAEGYDVTVQQASGVPGVARIEVVDPQGVAKRTVYYVDFKHRVSYGIPDNRPVFESVSVSASSHDGNVPENTLDGNMASRWSASGEQWIQYDLGVVREVGAISIAYYVGNTRTSFFKVEVSQDGEAWQQVFSGKSSGETADHEVFAFAPTDGRYVRITGFGNNQNAWNSMSEVKLYGKETVPVLAQAILICDECDGIPRKDSVPLQVKLLLAGGRELDPSEAKLAFYSTDKKVAEVKDGFIHTQKTGQAEIWVEATFRGVPVVSERISVTVAKKNGNGSEAKENEEE
ncbi:Ig-like domain-containing protein [Cohnella sp.]|uniref:Ig-like domain-containing protein n=1 Tax=Cohnella sp. TaxID=1883426 RepID=UPI0035662971